MLRKCLSVFVLSLISLSHVHAQDDLFGSEKAPERHGFVFGANGDFDIPGADMAKRFGLSYRLGPSLLYKTESNWYFGAKGDFIFGNKIKEQNYMSDIRDENGQFITANSDREGLGLFERGYTVGVQVGKLLPFKKSDPDVGVLFMLGGGFMQHKISIVDEDNIVYQLIGQYKKGYDRLTNGLYLEPYIAYHHIDKKQFLNFNIGLDLLAGFTQGRRSYQFDLMRQDNANRVDLLFGIRGGWYIPLFRRKSEEIFFDN